MKSQDVKALYESEMFEKVLEKLIQMEKKGELTSLPEDRQIEYIYYKSRALEGLGRFEEALRVATEAQSEFGASNKELPLLALVVAQLYALYRLGRLDEAVKVSSEGDAILKGLELEQPETDIFWSAQFFHIKGNIHSDKGELDTALEYYHKSKAVFETLNVKNEIAGSLNNIGIIYRQKGEFDLAIDHFQRSLALSEEINQPRGIVYPLFNIAYTYYSLGELNSALEYFQRSLAIWEDINNPQGISWVFMGIGVTYRLLGEDKLALDYLQRSLTLCEAIGNDLFTAYSIFYLILLSIDQQEQGQAQVYFTKLQQLTTNSTNKMITLASQLAKALILKQSKRAKDKFQAQSLLENIVNEEVINFDMTVLTMIHLCELLIIEVKSFNEPEVWKEAKSLIDLLYVKSQDQTNFRIMVEALVLRAKFESIEGNLPQALKYLDQAKFTAEEKKLSSLVSKVDIVKQRLEDEFDHMQALINSNASLQERLTYAKVEEYIKDVQKIVTPMK